MRSLGQCGPQPARAQRGSIGVIGGQRASITSAASSTRSSRKRGPISCTPIGSAPASPVGTDTAGGCYGNGGPVRLAWESTKKTGDASDGAAVVRFARSLPPGSFLRHHVVGDLGAPA